MRYIKREKNINITIEIRRLSATIARVKSHKIRSIFNFIRQINFRDRTIEIYLHVYYGRFQNNFGYLVPFTNTAICRFEKFDENDNSLEEKFWLAFDAFTEKGVSSE